MIGRGTDLQPGMAAGTWRGHGACGTSRLGLITNVLIPSRTVGRFRPMERNFAITGVLISMKAHQLRK